jgi:hypothetical protein
VRGNKPKKIENKPKTLVKAFLYLLIILVIAWL